jgi:hypothetical protein
MKSLRLRLGVCQISSAVSAVLRIVHFSCFNAAGAEQCGYLLPRHCPRAPFLVEKVLESWGTEKLFRILTALACTAALVSLMLLAVIRGDLMAQQLNDNAPALVLDDAAPGSQPANTFYGSAVPLLRIAMLLLSFAMELGAGLALHKAWRLSSSSTDDWDKLRSDLAIVRARMAAHTYDSRIHTKRQIGFSSAVAAECVVRRVS